MHLTVHVSLQSYPSWAQHRRHSNHLLSDSDLPLARSAGHLYQSCGVVESPCYLP
jgi:hypothetical protein